MKNKKPLIAILALVAAVAVAAEVVKVPAAKVAAGRPRPESAAMP